MINRNSKTRRGRAKMEREGMAPKTKNQTVLRGGTKTPDRKSVLFLREVIFEKVYSGLASIDFYVLRS